MRPLFKFSYTLKLFYNEDQKKLKHVVVDINFSFTHIQQQFQTWNGKGAKIVPMGKSIFQLIVWCPGGLNCSNKDERSLCLGLNQESLFHSSFQAE